MAVHLAQNPGDIDISLLLLISDGSHVPDDNFATVITYNKWEYLNSKWNISKCPDSWEQFKVLNYRHMYRQTKLREINNFM